MLPGAFRVDSGWIPGRFSNGLRVEMMMMMMIKPFISTVKLCSASPWHCRQLCSGDHQDAPNPWLSRRQFCISMAPTIRFAVMSGDHQDAPNPCSIYWV